MGSKLNASQIMDLAVAAGFTGADLSTAVAIALAESGGDPNAYNPEPQAGTPIGQGSYGLWQIYLKAHPELAGAPLFDPPTNAAAAYHAYAKAGGFSPWSTFKSGKYQAYLNSVPLVLDASTGTPVTDTPAPAAAADPSIDASFSVVEAGVLPSSISPTSVLIIAAAGLLVLYLLEG